MTTVQMKVILESIQNLLGKKNDKEEVEVSAPVIDDEMTSKLLRPDTVCINIDDGQKSLL